MPLPLKGHGDGKNIWDWRKKDVNAFVFTCKCFAFPEKLCVHLQYVS